MADWWSNLELNEVGGHHARPQARWGKPGMLDEDHWYGVGWVRLRKEAVKLTVANSAEFLSDVATGNDAKAAVSAWFQRLLKEINRRVGRSPGGMWSFVPSLLADNAAFARRVVTDLPALKGEKCDSEGLQIEPMRALGQLMTVFLNDARDQLGGTGAHQKAVWRRIRQVSDEIAKSGPWLGPGERCNDAHMHQVLNVLGERFPGDHNLPRTIDTLEWYFGRFCEDCANIPTQAVSWLVQDTGVLPRVEECLAALARENLQLAEAVAARFGLPLGTVSFLNAQAYRTQRGLSRRQFDQRIEKALPILARCIEYSVILQTGGAVDDGELSALGLRADRLGD